MAEPTPAPDPGNAPPEEWTEDLSVGELQKIEELLKKEND